MVLIEFPAELSEEVSAGEDAFPAFSKNMHDLLSDHNIVKVFCDGSGIQQSSVIGSKDISRIPRMETRCVERMCEEDLNYRRENTTGIDNEGGLPLSKVLEYSTTQFYPGLFVCLFVCVLVFSMYE